MKYLVTGGTGFIGAAVSRALLARGEDVRILDNGARGASRRLGPDVDEVDLMIADIRDPAAVKRAVRGVDCVIHLAYINGTRFFYEYPELVLDVGIRGMLNVVDACRSEGVGHLLVASSSEVYQNPPVLPTPEDVPLAVPDVKNPRYSYGGGKILTELIAMNYGRQRFDRVVLFRPHNIYGPDMGWEHVIPQFAMRAAELHEKHREGPLPFPIQGDGSETRAFMHIDDCADAVVHLAGHGEHLEIYHVGNPQGEVSIARLASLVCSHFERDAEIIPGTAALGSPSRRCPDIGKLLAAGYAPSIGLPEGLGATIDWYAMNRALGQSPVGERLELQGGVPLPGGVASHQER